MQTTAADFRKSVEAKLLNEGVPGRFTALDGELYQWSVGATPLAQLSFKPDRTIDISFIAPPDRYVEPWQSERLELTPSAIDKVAARIAAWIMFVDESPRKPT